MESLIIPAWSGKISPDFFLVSPQYLGDLDKLGLIEPLDGHFRQLPSKSLEDFQSDVVPIFRDSYTRFEGRTLALPVDGDVIVLHYRPSYFNDPVLKKKFKERYGQDLTVPRTWAEYDRTASFFTQNLRTKGVYGSYTFGTDPWVWAFWWARAHSRGARFFDTSMNPTVDSDLAVESLDQFIRLHKSSYPGIDDLSGGAVVKGWAEGAFVMTIWWSDLTELSQPSWSDPLDFASAEVQGHQAGWARLKGRFRFPTGESFVSIERSRLSQSRECSRVSSTWFRTVAFQLKWSLIREMG
jgi:ABC-type glycerol-3-phosphate transport system substrate-binding protein